MRVFVRDAAGRERGPPDNGNGAATAAAAEEEEEEEDSGDPVWVPKSSVPRPARAVVRI
jgi:hypothetical protein